MSPTQPTSFRLTDQAIEMLDAIQVHTGLKRSAVLETAIRDLYRKVITKRIAEIKEAKKRIQKGA